MHLCLRVNFSFVYHYLCYYYRGFGYVAVQSLMNYDRDKRDPGDNYEPLLFYNTWRETQSKIMNMVNITIQVLIIPRTWTQEKYSNLYLLCIFKRLAPIPSITEATLKSISSQFPFITRTCHLSFNILYCLIKRCNECDSSRVTLLVIFMSHMLAWIMFVLGQTNANHRYCD